MGASGAATTVNMETATLTGKLISIITSAWIVMMTWRTQLPLADIQLITGSQALNTMILSAIGAVVGGSLGYLVNKVWRWVFNDKKEK